jgi:hypothetical protein
MVEDHAKLGTGPPEIALTEIVSGKINPDLPVFGNLLAATGFCHLLYIPT